MCLNPKQIDKTNKTLLDLRARCDRSKLREAKSNPETHSVKDQVTYAKGKYTFGFKEEITEIIVDLIYVVQKTSCMNTRGKRSTSIKQLDYELEISI